MLVVLMFAWKRSVVEDAERRKDVEGGEVVVSGQK
jgi:hypothetical protein